MGVKVPEKPEPFFGGAKGPEKAVLKPFFLFKVPEKTENWVFGWFKVPEKPAL